MTYRIIEQLRDFGDDGICNYVTCYYVEDISEEFWSLSDAYAAILRNENVAVEIEYD